MATSKAPQTVINELVAMGFSDSLTDRPRRLIASVSGREKTGKDHFAFTAPEPIFFFDIDNGSEGVLEKFQRAGKKIYTYRVRIPKGADKSVYENMWAETKTRIKKVCEVNTGTLLLDTGTEIYELARLARFGKLEQVMPHHYALVNSEWRKEIMQWIFDSSLNAVLIHKVKPVYINEKRTGQYELAGFGETPYLVQANLTTFRERNADGQVVFGVRVDDCRQNIALCGEEYRSMPITSDSPLIDPILNVEFLLSQVFD